MASKYIPLVTIGITAYNAQGTIARAIQSALAQEWENFEIVVVDDCSTDSTAKIISHYANTNSCLSHFRQARNLGVAAARNRIVAESKGEFIAFFDDDDESEPLRISKQHERIVAYEAMLGEGEPLIVCYTAREHHYPDGRHYYAPTMGMDSAQDAPSGPAVAEHILTGKPLKNGSGSCANCSQMARKETFESLGGFDESLRRGEDTDLNIRLALAGGHFVGLAEALVHQNMTLTYDKKITAEWNFWNYILDKYRDSFQNLAEYGFSKKWLEVKFSLLAGRSFAFVRNLIRIFMRHPLRTMRRLLWSLPGTAHNLRFKKFHQSKDYQD
jgi:glycosyltransferase involved in cell wall biosynthesis